MKLLLVIVAIVVAVGIEQLPSYGHTEGSTKPFHNKVEAMAVPEYKPAQTVSKVPVSAVEIGQAEAAKVGWNGNQWQCLLTLWNGESGWNASSHNKDSGAHGIPQSLPASKMATVGTDYMDNPRTQIKWGIGYIQGRYNNPCNALSQWQARSPHWY